MISFDWAAGWRSWSKPCSDGSIFFARALNFQQQIIVKTQELQKLPERHFCLEISMIFFFDLSTSSLFGKRIDSLPIHVWFPVYCSRTLTNVCWEAKWKRDIVRMTLADRSRRQSFLIGRMYWSTNRLRPGGFVISKLLLKGLTAKYDLCFTSYFFCCLQFPTRC